MKFLKFGKIISCFEVSSYFGDPGSKFFPMTFFFSSWSEVSYEKFSNGSGIEKSLWSVKRRN